ncbi:MAG: OmpH family outer membrane protein [Bacteroidetes bacterium]|nr:OmpH family outer membrane protein [Bacteroidota bacterium]
MKKYLSIAITALLFVAVPKFAQAQAKATPTTVAHINLDSLLQIMPAYKAAMDSAQGYYNELEQVMYTMQLELQKKAAEFDSLSKTLSPILKANRQKELQDLQHRIQDFQQNAQDDFTNKRAALLQPVYLKIQKAVKDVAIARGYKYVLDSSQSSLVVLYAAPTDDIFNDVRNALKIPLPAVKPAPAPGGK